MANFKICFNTLRLIYGIKVYGSAQKTIAVISHDLISWEMRAMYICILYKCYYLVYCNISYTFTIRLEQLFHSHNTGSSSLYHLSHNFAARSGSCVFLSSCLWNNLGPSIWQCNSLSAFKQKLKLHLMIGYL